MNTLARQSIYESFLDHLRSAPSRILLLDYDGTLAPFQTDRDHAFPYPEVPGLLGGIIERETRVVLISGRPARELLVLSGIHPHPEIWGSHGLERLKQDGTYEAESLPAEQETGLLQAAEALRVEGLESQVELKPGGVALHWRGLDASGIERLKSKIQQLWTPLLQQYSLRLLDFDGGIELRGSRKDKGNAVSTILGESSSNAALAYLGDDRTDEDAFRALKGKGLTALVRPQARTTAADIWLRPPEELVQFLKDWLNACGGDA